MSPIVITFLILGGAVAAFIWNKIPVGVVAIGVSLALYLTGVLSFEQSLAGFGDPVVIYIAALFVVSEALDMTGVTVWAGQQVIQRAGKRVTVVLVWLMLLVALVTALISVNGAVAALIPVGVVLAIRVGSSPSRMLMPLAFAAHAGSLLTLTGTPVNLLVSEISENAGYRPFGFLEFGLVGLPLLVGTVIIVLLLGPRVLPERLPEFAPRNLSRHAETLARHYSLEPDSVRLDRADGLTEIVIPPRSTFVGDTVFPGMRTETGELVIVAVQRSGEDIGRTRLKEGICFF
ncbi:SLC13 family permease [Leucobacter coleopterorum]|uniref:SLC13 family permease n=1 Tax=Leucobacter coleopterorum TaxID=2714933 RepID=UPI001FCC9B29|nr:SLC13 family permease [Leucobacter coleopterorum]